MRAQFGKVNTLHTHAMPTVDRPLVTENLVGGEDGLSDSGVSLSKLISNPCVFLEATGEVYAGHRCGVSERRGVPGRPTSAICAPIAISPRTRTWTSACRTRTARPTSALADGLDLNKELVGIDATFRYRPLRRAIYQRLNLRTELIWSRQQLPEPCRTTAFGVTVSASTSSPSGGISARGPIDRAARSTARARRPWRLGVPDLLADRVQPDRGQFRHTSFAEGRAANEVLFQINFAIGAHGAHVF